MLGGFDWKTGNIPTVALLGSIPFGIRIANLIVEPLRKMRKGFKIRDAYLDKLIGLMEH